MREEVYSQLLTWIMDGTFHPGEKLVDKDLADNMGVSRTPVREALCRLEDKGLVESAASRWTRVAEVSPEEPGMIYPVIWTLEELAMSMAAANITGSDIQDMENSNKMFKQALMDNDPVASTRFDADFHDVFINRSGNPHLKNILSDLKVMYRRLEILFFEGYTHITSSFNEHEQIISALKQNETEKALKILHTNWVNSLERLNNRTNKDFNN